MIDTTSINYALSKISEGWQKAAPTLQNVGEKYVRYVVTKQAMESATFLIAALIFLAAWVKLLKASKKWCENDSTNPAFALSVVFGGMAALVIGGFLLASVYDSAVALLNPEMYTVQSVIESARGH